MKQCVDTKQPEPLAHLRQVVLVLAREVCSACTKCFRSAFRYRAIMNACVVCFLNRLPCLPRPAFPDSHTHPPPYRHAPPPAQPRPDVSHLVFDARLVPSQPLPAHLHPRQQHASLRVPRWPGNMDESSRGHHHGQDHHGAFQHGFFLVCWCWCRCHRDAAASQTYDGRSYGYFPTRLSYRHRWR